MAFEGGCYCGAVRYVSEGEPVMKGECHCRECQYIAGGGPNIFMAMPTDGFRYTKGKAKKFARADLANPVTREFCPDCGTHLVTLAPGFPAVIVKVGTLDDPAAYGGPQVAIYTCDMQSFHQIPPGIPSFERLPG
ncbi:GFA family protein [Zavarzinia sp.]|uniref:GFA family protein n=1 Tax=Zavarzinia sp. TaxID=2027920 RepID=UPI003563AB69